MNGIFENDNIRILLCFLRAIVNLLAVVVVVAKIGRWMDRDGVEIINADLKTAGDNTPSSQAFHQLIPPQELDMLPVH